MNKTFCRKCNIFSIILAGCLILFNLSSCGLDTFYVIDAPSNVIHQPQYSSIDYSDNYFDFYTVDRSYDGFKYLGTEVYYKIYKSSDRLKSETEYLQSLANKQDASSVPAENLIQSYKYQPLRAEGHEDDTVLIAPSGSDDNRRVVIRLSTYTVYPARITIDDTHERGIPVRNLPQKKYFNFKSGNQSSYSVPTSDEVDVNANGSSSNSDWYVSLFAVAIGQDTTYTPIYSNILYLGSVRIPLE